MRVCIIGLGYVGLTLGVALAEAGHEVYGVEKNVDILDKLKDVEIPFFEEGLRALLNSIS